MTPRGRVVFALVLVALACVALLLWQGCSAPSCAETHPECIQAAERYNGCCTKPTTAEELCTFYPHNSGTRCQEINDATSCAAVCR